MRINPWARKSKKKRRSRAPASDDGGLSPYVKKAILGIVLLVFSLIALLSFGSAAGPVGNGILMILKKIFGWLAYLVPFGLIVWGGHLVWPQRLTIERMRVIGLTLTFLGLLGLVHLLGVTPDDALQAAHEGQAGGYLGFLLSFPLSQALSRVAATLIFLGSVLIGLVLVFRLSPADVWDKLTGLWSGDGEEELAEEGGSEEKTFRFQVSPVLRAPDNRTSESSKEQPSLDKEISRRNVTNKRYRPAILKILQESTVSAKMSKEDEKTIKETVRRKLEHFGIRVEMGGTSVGPTVTQFTLRPEEGTKLSRITVLQNDLALALAAHPIRIEAPIPNTNLVGIEIPNKAPTLVRLKGLLTSKEFKEAESPLAFPLGQDVSGKVVVESLDRLPHLLIAGATGSGKSVAIHSLLISWLFRNTPDALRLILVDPKRVELPPYNGIPHLLSPVIVDTEKTINALKWAIGEMEVRYRLLEESGARNLPSFNLNNPTEAKPYIVIVIDELADLMMKHARDVEGPIVRLSQMARAVGIHLVLATQRPSVNVLTGLIKANIPSRVAFTVASQVDSRTILDMSGAEKLVGNGDMLYLAGDKARPMRIQGGFVSEEEVRNVVEVIKASGEPDYNEEVTAMATSGGGGRGGDGEMGDPLLDEAKKLVVQANKASASLLQRRLRVGYARAARLLDMLEEQGVIGAAEGNKPRPILVESLAEDNRVPVEEDKGETEVAEGDEELEKDKNDPYYQEDQW